MGRESLAADLYRAVQGSFAEQVHALYRELVASERASLVTGDHRARAQALDGRQAANDHLAPRHAVRGDGQRDRNSHRQALRDGGHGESHGDEKNGDQRGALQQKDQAQRRDESHGCDADDLAESLKSAQQRRLFGQTSCERLGDPANLGPAPRRRDYAGAAPGQDGRSGVQHVAALGERHRDFRQRVMALLDRSRLSGQ